MAPPPTQRIFSRMVAAAATLLYCSAAAFAADPPVPPGRDPGGRAVALICDGLDYTRANITQMLARDGEGEIIGYDFADDDRRPYSATGSTETAETVISEGQATTLIALRANPADPVSLAKAIGYAAQSPAKIIAIALPWASAEALTILQAASKRFARNLFIVAAPGQNVPDMPNVLSVTALNAATKNPADLAIGLDAAGQHDPAMAAIARAAALAARRQAVEPGEDGATLKQSLIKLAVPMPANAGTQTRAGWISEPRRHFWLE